MLNLRRELFEDFSGLVSARSQKQARGRAKYIISLKHVLLMRAAEDSGRPFNPALSSDRHKWEAMVSASPWVPGSLGILWNDPPRTRDPCRDAPRIPFMLKAACALQDFKGAPSKLESRGAMSNVSSMRGWIRCSRLTLPSDSESCTRPRH